MCQAIKRHMTRDMNAAFRRGYGSNDNSVNVCFHQIARVALINKIQLNLPTIPELVFLSFISQ